MHRSNYLRLYLEKQASLKKEAFPITTTLATIWALMSLKNMIGSGYSTAKNLVQGRFKDALKQGAWTGIHAIGSIPMAGYATGSLARAAKGAAALSKGTKASNIVNAMYKSRYLAKDKPLKWMMPIHKANVSPLKLAAPLMRKHPEWAKKLTRYANYMENPATLAGKMTAAGNSMKVWLPIAIGEMVAPNFIENPAQRDKALSMQQQLLNNPQFLRDYLNEQNIHF